MLENTKKAVQLDRISVKAWYRQAYYMKQEYDMATQQVESRLVLNPNVKALLKQIQLKQ
jgi:hypothetical protein